MFQYIIHHKLIHLRGFGRLRQDLIVQVLPVKRGGEVYRSLVVRICIPPKLLAEVRWGEKGREEKLAREREEGKGD